MQRQVKFLIVVLLLGLFSLASHQSAVTQSSVTDLGAVLTQTDWGKFKVETIQVCADGDTGWGAAAGPGSLDDLELFPVTGLNSGQPEVGDSILFGDNDDFGPGPGQLDGTGLPAGMGPRGFPGLALNYQCTNAYVPSLLNSNVAKVNLATGLAATANNESGSVNFDDGTIVWPANYQVDGFSVEGLSLFPDSLRNVPNVVDVQLNLPSETKVFASSGNGALYVLNANTGAVEQNIATGGVGSGSILATGNAWVAVVESSRDIACVDLGSGNVTKVGGLGINPFMGVANNDRSRFYVSNQSSNSVSVLSGAGCVGKHVIKEIAVGSAPRHIALSPDGRFLYVSNSTDNTVSVINTGTLTVVDTIEVAAPGEQAPVGMLLVSGNNRYVYVYWEGAIKSTPGQFEILGYDVSSLY